MKRKIGINTFGLGPTLRKDEMGTWEGLRKGGIACIEPSIAVRWNVDLAGERNRTGYFDGVFPEEKAPEKIRMLRDMGFEVFTFHLQTSELGAEVADRVVSLMEEQGLRYCVYSFMISSVEKIRGLADTIRLVRETLAARGFEFLVHNHNMEWRDDGGTTVMEWMLDELPEQRFELDVGWTEYAGHDSVAILKRYPGRFPLLHFKEIAKGAEAWTDRPFCVAPGEGILPLREILDVVRTMDLEDRALIIDQDNSIRGDIVADYAQGVREIGRILGDD